MVKGQLRITDESGKTLQVPDFPGSGRESSVTEDVVWLSDGEALIVHRLRGFHSWSDAKGELPKDEALRIEELAESIPMILGASIALGGGGDNLDAILGRLHPGEPDTLRNAFYLSFERDPGALLEIFSEAPKLRSQLERESDDSMRFLVNQLDLVRWNRKGETAILSLSSGAVLLSGMTISPDARRLLIGRRLGEKSLVDLYSINLESGAETRVARRVFPAFAWQDDATVLALAPVVGSNSVLKQLKRFPLGDTGTNQTNVETLATALVPFLPRIEVLADSSVLLASQEEALPAAGASPHPGSALYRYVAETRELLRVPSPEGALPMNLGFFAASPDGERAAVVESDTDAVAVVELSSGSVAVISEPRPNSKCRTLPAWRNADELSFARFNQETRKVEWLIWERNGRIRVLNDDWAPDLTADWIEVEKSESN